MGDKQPNSENEELLKRLRKDFFTMTPPSEFRKEIMECFRDESVVDKSEGFRKIMDKYGYEKLSVDDLNKLVRFKPDEEAQKPLPVDPPVTKPVSETSASFSLSMFAGIYKVTSVNPPALQIAIKETADGQPGKVEFVGKNKQFIPKLELESDTGDYWISWTDDKTSYRIKLWTQWNKEQKKISKHFAGYILNGTNTTPIKFEGEGEDPDPEDKDNSPSLWDKYGMDALIAGVILYALGSYYFKRRARRAQEQQDQARHQEALGQEKATADQAAKHFAETRAMAEASAAEKFLDSTSQARRQALLDSTLQGLREKFNQQMDVISPERKNGGLVFDFAGQDAALRKEFDKVVEAKIKAWVDANPTIPANAALKEMMEQGIYDAGNANQMAERIRAEAKVKVEASMNGEYGEYKDLIDNCLDSLRNEFNRNTLDSGIIDADHQVQNITNEVQNIQQHLTDLFTELNQRRQEYKDGKGGKTVAELKDWKEKYNHIIDNLNNEIDQRQHDRKVELDKRDAVDKKKKESVDAKEKAEKDRKEAEKKQKEREAHFKEHMKLHH
jgi:hypothetical protein